MSDHLAVTFPGGKRVDVQVGGFRVATDQSEKNGGEGSAPAPFDLFLASIAACSGIYALNFCQTRDIPTQGLGLSLSWEPGAKDGTGASATLRLRLPEGFPERYRDGIVRSMDLCAVKKSIVNAPSFTVEIEA
ncbi:MAG: OsmC family protein [Thiohalocapsa sp.]|nr:OsmC family protein [Thiohalocapsa sp.]MCF7992256.1 OsmC family protein [Thiohalocapsa sp.]